MIAKLELVSFHIAVFFASFLAFFAYYLDRMGIVALGLCLFFSIFLVGAISNISSAYAVSSWAKASPHGASIVIFLGHLAPLSAVYLCYSMYRAGAGSGIIFLPIFVWAEFFYWPGIVWSLVRLAKEGSQEIKDSNNQVDR